MKKKITIHDLAKILEIDSSTVSRALANSPRVKQKTRNLIQAKAKELGYFRNIVASNLRSKRGRTIGVIVPYISRYFLSTVIAGIEEYAFKNEYRVIICQSQDEIDREKELIQTLLSYQVDGVLISISMQTDNFDHFKNITDQEVPVVFFDRKCNKAGAINIHIDDYQRAYDATQHLIDNGCKRIAHFTGSDKISIYHDRKNGYCDALENNDLAIEKKLILQSQLKETDGKELAKQILLMEKKPDGVFCANDVTAISAMQYLINNNVKIPRDIAFVGYSNEPLGNYITPSLTSVNQNPKAMGHLAFETMLERISNNVLSKSHIVPSSLIIRKSSIRK